MPGPFSLATVVVFALAAAAAGRAAAGLPHEPRRLWALLALGFGWLAVNKFWEIQERIHVQLHKLGVGDPPALAGLDDLVLLAYGVAALGVLAWHWRALIAHPRSAAAIGGAGALFVGAFLVDSFGPNHGALADAEQWAELAGAAVLAVAGWLRARLTARTPAATPERAHPRAAPTPNRPHGT